MKLIAPAVTSMMTIAEINQNEARFLMHCTNIAHIMAHADSVQHGKAKIVEYLKITDNKEIENE